MIPSGLTSSVINRARLGDGYVRVRDSGLVAAVAQFLYDEATLLDMPWSDISRGMYREHTGQSCCNADERQMRAFWRQWQKLMSAR
jgi:hypothetical protein